MKKKTIALFNVNKSGLWIDAISEIEHDRQLTIRPGAWVAQMGYDTKVEGYFPAEVRIMHSSFFLSKSPNWKVLPDSIDTRGGVIGVRPLEDIRKFSKNLTNRTIWSEKVIKTLGNRDFSEFDNFFAFRAPENSQIDVAVVENNYKDVIGVKLFFREAVS